MAKPKVGLLGLTLEFYERSGPELREGRDRWVRRKLLPALEPVAEVRFDGAVFTREAVEQAVAGFEAEGCDCICVVLVTYSPSLISAPALQRTSLPIVVWNTQELSAVDESYDTAALIANHGVHGTHDLCNVLRRAGVEFHYVTSHVDDESATDELADFFAAAATARKLRSARLGLLGYPFPGMGDFGLDTTHMATTLGCAWEAVTVSEYVHRSAEADAGDVAALVGQYRESYEIADDITDEDLAAAARAELAVRGIVADRRLDALSYQFLAFGEDDRVETLPFVAASRMMAEGIGFGGEGDLISAAGTCLLNWLAPPASFSEIFTIDFAGNAVLLSHMGEANAAMHRTDRKLRMVKRAKGIVPTRAAQLALATTFAPGAATLTALTLAAGGRWRIIAAPMTVEHFGPLDQLATPHTKAAPDGDVRDFLTAYASAGGPHHLAVCFGDARRRVQMACQMLDADYWEV
ncbi:MAG: L-arabinose isomerase family protein [Planctomycetota bacterium]|jgi:L-arabinose isomerase